jgi:predicted dinucleotide-binding enzyme
MNIVILGKGNMGAPLAKLAAKAGIPSHTFGSSDNPIHTLSSAYIVIFAMKYEQALDFAVKPGVAERLAGKVIVDITNPLAPDFMSLTVGYTSSAAEEIAKRLPGAHVVKAFNTIFASVLASRASGETVTIPVFVAGDDTGAVSAVVKLVQDFGFQAIGSGPLANARYLEPMTELMIHLGYAHGHGDKIGFSLVRAS